MGVLEMVEAEGLIEVTPSRRAALQKLDDLEVKIASAEERLAWLEGQIAMAESFFNRSVDELRDLTASVAAMLPAVAQAPRHEP